MKLDNDTPYAARMFRGEPEPDIMLGTVLVQVAYRVGDRGEMMFCPAEDAVIREEAEVAPLGILPSDQVPYRSGVDVFVHGQAYAPRGRPTEAMVVGMKLGSFSHELLVVGDRTWEQDGVASRPKPFTTMPLVYERAYGGLAHYREAQVAFPDNPEGRGYVCEAVAAAGTALPNVEDPNARIKSWRDQPTPRGWAPLPPQTGLHLRRSVQVLDLNNYTYRFTKHAFSCAHPDLTLDALEPGSTGILSGVTPSGVFRFSVPRLSLKVDVQLGDKAFELVPRFDTLALFPEDGRVVASFRTSFRYRVQAKQVRRVRLSVTPPKPGAVS